MYSKDIWRSDRRRHGQRNQRYTPRQDERADIAVWTNGETFHHGTMTTYHKFEACGIMTFIRWKLSRTYPEICFIEFAANERYWMPIEADPANAEALRVAAIQLIGELASDYHRWRTLRAAGMLHLLDRVK